MIMDVITSGTGLIVSIFLTTALTAVLYLRWAKKGKEAPYPPGPLGLPLLGHLPFLDPDLHRCFADLSRTYGPVMSIRLGLKRCIVLSSPSVVSEALRNNNIIFANHDAQAAFLAINGAGEDLVWAPYESPYRRMLRKLTVHNLLSSSSIEAVRSLRRREVRRMVAEVHANAGIRIEVRELIFMTTLNMMTSMLWGGTVDDEAVGKEFKQTMDGIIDLLAKPNVSDFYPVLAPLDIQGRGSQMVRLTDWYFRIFDTIVEDRRRKITSVLDAGVFKEKDFLQVVLDLLDKGEDSHGLLKIHHVKLLFLEMIAGGTDTTSTTVEWAMAELLSNPNIMKNVQEELDMVVGKNRVVEESDFPRLQYLDAVVKEVLRLHPALPLLVPHCPSSNCTIGGFSVPKGVKVFVNVWTIHREASVWEDPLKFKPERFLSGNYDYNGNNFDYLPFGSGRRICVGISLGEKIVMYILASLLHSFDWRLPEDTMTDLTDKFGIVLRKAKPLVAVPYARLGRLEYYA